MEEFADGKLLYLNKNNLKEARVITLPIKIIRNNTTIIKLNNNVNYNEISKGRNKTLEHKPELSRTFTNPEPIIHRNFEEKIIKLNKIAFHNSKQTKKKKPLSIYKRKTTNDKYPLFSNQNTLYKCPTSEATEHTSFILTTCPSYANHEEEFTFRAEKEKQDDFELFKKKSDIIKSKCVFNFKRNKELHKENNTINKEREILFSPVKSMNIKEEYIKCSSRQNNYKKYDISFNFLKRRKSDVTI